MQVRELLKHYWGYDSFRPLQEDIVNSVLAGNDTLALLPTGGGKSICFQVPALAMPGMCLVVSPLIALMKDQVEQLQSREIAAAAIYSGMSTREQLLTLENAQQGAYKFLYVSPERLKSSAFRDRMPHMQINLLAIDEAHCISQWGYDFRPEYLLIAEVREWLKGVPVLALTASATEQVVQDIQERLKFKKSVVYKKSFTRNNLSYVVNQTENKQERMLHVIRKVNGSGLVYVRNRKQTQDIAKFLRSNGIVADFYHAGLPHEVRERKQDDWIRGKTRIMVCTNAFGMGIDKPDCRLVIHIEMPESLESYYQEAGRAGRDGNRAYCVLLHHRGDEDDAKHKLALNFPSSDEIRRVYQALCNFYNVPVGALTDRSFDFDLATFIQRFKLNALTVYPALKLLAQCDLIALNESFFEPSKLKFTVSHAELYKFQVEHEQFDEPIKLLLRSYGGLFDTYARIDELQLAKRLHTNDKLLVQQLMHLHRLGIIDYQPQKDQPQLQFTGERVAAEQIDLKPALLEFRRQTAQDKLAAMITYATNATRCRSRMLVAYFNEFTAEDCGICDVCIEAAKRNFAQGEPQRIEEAIAQQLAEGPLHAKELIQALSTFKPENVTAIVRYLLDIDKLQYDNEQRLTWK